MQQCIKIEWKKLISIILACIAIIGLAAVLSLLLLGGLPAGGQSDTTVFNGDKDGIFFLGHVYQVNVENRSVSISWLVGGCGNLQLQNAPNFGTESQCGQASVPLDVYINNERQFHYDPTIQPRTSTNVTLFVQDFNGFQHTHTMDINNTRLWKHIFEHEYFYPFDTYALTTTFITLNTVNNTSLPILSLAVSDIVDNFHPDSSVQTDTQSILNNASMHSRTLSLRLQRTDGTRVYVMVLFSTTWLLTIAVIYPTIIALFGTPSNRIGDSVALLPMTIVLTLPHLRQLYPDAPAFGLFLDSLSLVLQLSIVSICAIILLCFTIRVKPTQKAPKVDLKEFDTRTLTDDAGYYPLLNATSYQ